MESQILEKNRIAIIVIAYSLSLLFLPLIMRFLNGLDPDELKTLMGLLSPSITLYGGFGVSYFFENETNPRKEKTNKISFKIAKTFIHLYFIVTLLAIIAKSLFNFPAFNDMMMFLVYFETILNLFLGKILLSVFK